jgi:hypothetical protein
MLLKLKVEKSVVCDIKEKMRVVHEKISEADPSSSLALVNIRL